MRKLYTLLSLFMIFGCSSPESINQDLLNKKDGVFYTKDTNEPYSGTVFYLYDDGSEDILYEPDFTSGDSFRGDGIYSFRIPVYGSGNTDPNFQTQTGTFRWDFITQDKADEYGTPVLHEDRKSVV